MSENKFETISTLVDQFSTNDTELKAMLDLMAADSQLSDTWGRYHLIGDLMRGEVSTELHLDLSDSVMAALAEEQAPQLTLVQQTKAKVVYLFKPLGQLAIAASAAGLMILGVQQANMSANLDGSGATIMPNQVVQTTPLGGVIAPVSLNYQGKSQVNRQQAVSRKQAARNDYAIQQRRIHALLSDHAQQIKLQTVDLTKTLKENEEQLSEETTQKK